MSNNKKEKACWDQFYFQNAVFTEKEPDEDQDYKDYVDIWLSLKWSNCTNKYIYVSIIGCDLHGSQFACQRNFMFWFFKEGDLWSWHPACDQLCSQSPRLEADIRENLLRLRLSLHQLTPTSLSNLVHLLVHLPIHLAVYPLVHLLHHTQHQNQLHLLQIKQSWSIWNG